MHGLADSFADQLRQGYPASDNPATRPLIEGQPFSQILDVTQHEFPFARDRGSARTRPPNLLAHYVHCGACRYDATTSCLG